MIYALYDNAGRRLGAAATWTEAVEIRARWCWANPRPEGRVASIPTIREEEGEAHPSGYVRPREAVERIHKSLDRAEARGEIEP